MRRAGRNLKQSYLLSRFNTAMRDGRPEFPSPPPSMITGQITICLGTYIFRVRRTRRSCPPFTGEFLKAAGMEPEDYRIEAFLWDGEPYEDEGGVICRDVLILGAAEGMGLHGPL